MLKRYTPLKRTPLRRISKKRAKESRIYTQKRKVFLKAHPWCQVALQEAGNPFVVWSDPCPEGHFLHGNVKIGRSTEIHHKAGRTGTNYLDESTWLAVCRQSHERIHNNPSWARERGYLV
jgi:hypothetical protein